MAAKLQLELWNGEPLESGSPTYTLNLLTYTDDFELAYSGYEPGVAQDENTPIIEKIKLRVKEASHDALSASLQDMAKYLQAAKFSQSASVAVYTVWLRTKLTNETGDRVAYIYDIDVSQNDKYNQVTNSKSAIVEYTLIVKRAPLWERDVNANDVTPRPGGGFVTYNAYCGGPTEITVAGDSDARLRQIALAVPPPGTSPFNIDEVWIGWGSDPRYPSFGSKFDPQWNLEDLACDGPDTALATVADSVGTQVAQCTFASATAMTPRLKIAIGDVYASLDEPGSVGKYLVLLRAGLSGAGECHVRLGTGAVNNTWNTTDPFAKLGRVSVTKNTGWCFYELGVVQFPLGGYGDSTNVSRFEGLQIEAERISGSVSLNMDILVFIPIGEGWVHVSGIADAAGQSYGITISNTYNTGVTSRSSASSPAKPTAAMLGDVPRSSGAAGDKTYLVVCAQRNGASVKADTIVLASVYIKNRYLELRGAG
ncbi:MAG: hypothetical protein C4575_12965 [Desulforudis sp.]|jgi:hypothetical protein|nr:MAG: hypothetical protein C4575_12965 [Desulforudis sp.]